MYVKVRNSLINYNLGDLKRSNVTLPKFAFKYRARRETGRAFTNVEHACAHTVKLM